MRKSLNTFNASDLWLVRLIFAGSEHIDKIWASIAGALTPCFPLGCSPNALLVSLVTGPLSATVAHTAKVSTSPLDDVPNYRHVLCIYMPDVYDKDAVVEVGNSLP